MSERAIETMARALCSEHSDNELTLAETAFAALTAAGYRLAGPDEVVVPRSLIDKFRRAGCTASGCDSQMNSHTLLCPVGIVTAMIAAAEDKPHD